MILGLQLLADLDFKQQHGLFYQKKVFGVRVCVRNKNKNKNKKKIKNKEEKKQKAKKKKSKINKNKN